MATREVDNKDLRVKKLRVAGVRADKALRAVYDRDLSDEDIEINSKLGRPLDFVETVHPEAEAQRRDSLAVMEQLRAEVDKEETRVK